MALDNDELLISPLMSLVVLALVGRAPNAARASAPTLLPPLLLRPPLLSPFAPVFPFGSVRPPIAY